MSSRFCSTPNAARKFAATSGWISLSAPLGTPTLNRLASSPPPPDPLPWRGGGTKVRATDEGSFGSFPAIAASTTRSEERRVGKECGPRCTQEQCEKGE